MHFTKWWELTFAAWSEFNLPPADLETKLMNSNLRQVYFVNVWWSPRTQILPRRYFYTALCYTGGGEKICGVALHQAKARDLKKRLLQRPMPDTDSVPGTIYI